MQASSNGNVRFPKAINYLNSFALGGLFIASFAPINLVIAGPICVFLLTLLFCSARSAWSSFFLGFAAGAGFSLAGYYWFYYAVEHAIGLPWLACLAVVGAAILGGVLYGILARLLYSARNFKPVFRFLIATCLWSTAEYVRCNWLFGGIPLHILGTVWGFDLYMAQCACYISLNGLSWLTYMLSLSPLVLFNSVVRLRLKIALIGILTLVLTAGHILGYKRVDGYSSLPRSQQEVLVIQPSVPQDMKISGINEGQNLQHLLEITGAMTSSYDNLLVLWPETSLNNLFLRPNSDLAFIRQHLHGGATLVAGTIRMDEQGRIFNSALIANPSTGYQNYYDKIHLVPFGEYIPFGGLLHSFIPTLAFDSQINVGLHNRIYKINQSLKFKVLICFEGLFSYLPWLPESPDFIINISNQAWFDSSVEPYEALQVSRFRAVESGIPLIVCANSGLSAMVDGVGRIIHVLPLNAVSYFKAYIPCKGLSGLRTALWVNNLLFLINYLVMIILCFCLLKENRVFGSKKI